MTGSSALMAIGHILMCYTLFFSFHANKALGYGATVLESNKSHAPPSCSGTTTGLRVVHKYGPCSPSGLKKTPAVASQILAQDKLRVRAMNSRLHNRRTIGLEGEGTTDTYLQNDLPGAGNFLVSVGFGTPQKDFNLALDTGSYVTWVQCEPCTESPCPQQQNASLYYPSFSSTYSNAPCSPRCNYTQTYLDKSKSGGVFILDTVSIGQDYQIPEFIFLCAVPDKEIGDFGEADGILGLGLASSGDEFATYSLATQTANLFGRVFCHCLPSSGNSGYVYFGEKAREQCPFSGTYTRLLRNPVSGANYYFVNLIAITLGQKKVEVPSGILSSPGTIIDSGTVITHLPSSVYSELSQEFDRLMSEFPPANPSDDGVLKACYNLVDHDNAAIPEMVLHFENLDVHLDQTAVTWKGNGMSQVCFAFAAKEDEGDVTIIGNHQQQKLNMLFNIPYQRLEIGPVMMNKRQ
ncbi:hypothetical protein J1N35_032230 [Gossypium stocksii]|uniref:Peptidase A1 domain-containing protein n=1 Tax=Gossypium stocksii TaxID=47602 RepID=A0A9D3V346_9ROSI|nr:hypothetical protein J1N35_032230 [Gossypium stocksii]